MLQTDTQDAEDMRSWMSHARSACARRVSLEEGTPNAHATHGVELLSHLAQARHVKPSGLPSWGAPVAHRAPGVGGFLLALGRRSARSPPRLHTLPARR